MNPPTPGVIITRRPTWLLKPKWTLVARLWQQAEANGYRPAASVELLPFIEASARTSNWEQARRLSLSANTLPPRMPDWLYSL